MSQGRQGSVSSVSDLTSLDNAREKPAQLATNRIIRLSIEDRRLQCHLLGLWLPTDLETSDSAAALQVNRILAHRPITADKRTT